MNKIFITGNLTRNLEVKNLPSGQALAKGGIAVNRRYKDASGQQKEETMFIDFAIWGAQANTALQYLHKGSRVLLEGRLELEQWVDQSGQKRSKHSVNVERFEFLDKPVQQGQPAQPYAQPAQQPYAQPAPQQAPAQQYAQPQPVQPQPAPQPQYAQPAPQPVQPQPAPQPAPQQAPAQQPPAQPAATGTDNIPF